VDTAGAQDVLAAYDDRPDGKLDLEEFAELVRDIEAGATRTSTKVLSSSSSSEKKKKKRSERPATSRSKVLAERTQTAPAASASYRPAPRAYDGRSPSESFRPSVAAAFDHFDTNRSGFLDYRELRPALKLYGIDVSNEAAKQVVAAYDDRVDGVLDFDEFNELVRDIEGGETRAAGQARAPPPASVPTKAMARGKAPPRR
jgi:hypothetical protein